jgi:predicted DNA-binding transcriptional regulator AlpA
MRLIEQGMMGDAPPLLLTLALIRKHYFPVGERTIFRLISSGRFPRADVRMGGKLRLWKRETIETWVAATAENSS